MKYIIHGNPQPQERPRATTIGGKARLYDPPKSRAYKKHLQQEVLQYLPVPTDKPLSVHLTIFVPIPKSYTKKQRAQIEKGLLYPSKKPDLSNYIKLIEDAFNGILYKDDSQIVELMAKKEYSGTPRIEFSLKEL